MVYSGSVRRWNTYWADLEPGVGREQKGLRPVIVISNDGFNASFEMVTVVPLTKFEGKERSVYPFEVLLPRGTVTAGFSSIVLVHQIRAISKLRLHDPIGAITDEAHRRSIENGLLEHLDIPFDPGDDLTAL